MTSLVSKKIAGKTYWYAVESARVGGKPRMVNQRYLGTAAEVAAAVRGATVLPERTRHLAFGDLAAVWGMLERLKVIEIVDEVAGQRRVDAAASVGTYIALATANRVVAPCSKLAFATWWPTTAGDRFTQINTEALEHRLFWKAMNAVSAEDLRLIERRIAAVVIEEFGVDPAALVLDMTNFATFIDSANAKAPIAQRGKAKQKRTDLRLVGLGLVVTRDGGVPLISHAYPGNKPDVTQFPRMLEELADRYRALAQGKALDPASAPAAGEVTVVFDAGQNSAGNFARLADLGLHYVGSLPPCDHPDLLAVPASRRRLVDPERFGGLTAYQTRTHALGACRRVILTHSPTFHQAQAAGFDQTLATAQRRLGELADTLARGRTRRNRPAVQAAIDQICKPRWVDRVLTTHLTGTTPATFRLAWSVNQTARQALEEEIFGKRILVTDHDHWPMAEVVAAYRWQAEAEAGFRQLKDPHVVSFSPMFHWTDHNIRVHLFYCVLALTIAHLMRRQAELAGLRLSVRELLAALAGIQETVLTYPSTGGRPKTRRMITDITPTGSDLSKIFDLDRYAPSIR
jgi:transposase